MINSCFYWALLRLEDIDIYIMPSPEGMTTKYLPPAQPGRTKVSLRGRLQVCNGTVFVFKRTALAYIVLPCLSGPEISDKV